MPSSISHPFLTRACIRTLRPRAMLHNQQPISTRQDQPPLRAHPSDSISRNQKFHTTTLRLQQQQQRPPYPISNLDDTTASRPSFYRSHGRAFFKSLTLAFFTFQVTYWYWLLVDTDKEKDELRYQLDSAREEVKMLVEGSEAHRGSGGGGRNSGGKRLLEEDVVVVESGRG